MVRKLEAKDANVDWRAVNRATEVRRTYLITDLKTGREFFKMYKPSEVRRIFQAEGWKGRIVGKLVLNKQIEPVRMPANYISETARKKGRDNAPREVHFVRMSDFNRV